MPDKELKPCATVDYETECRRLSHKCDELRAKLADTEEKARCLHEENLRYKAIMKTLEFVFGRKFDG